MKHGLCQWAACVFLASVGGIVAADAWKLPPETTKLKPGPGAEIYASQCLTCHSADYVSTQPRLTPAAWDATVKKMKDRYGAPIPAEQTNALVKYLATAYGRETPSK